jgi:hypothetical protein
MIGVRPVLHLYDEFIESQVLCSPGSTVVKFHAACDLEELQNLVESRLTADELEVFTELFANDSAKRRFEAKKGFLIIS